VLLEFADAPESFAVWVVSPDRVIARYTLADLIPHGFRLAPEGG
jgi:hypothetical protein